ncbi:MAG: N-acyl-D-amino-acid deacylase [Cytophagales bacterium]|jgi:N-acyl-D-amino-acid deacylase|nr:D-aminoacylase [Bacteroidota bacterium]MBS1979824.1 D-aminoacylase [Bacteroidota bacterium]WHZ07110.1 MAG: N-acyl-D-amino-acid deacylase [Cytophagales bacterium]
MRILLLISLLLFSSFNPERKKFDIVLRHGLIYDGLGGKPYHADIGINADTIAFIGDLSRATGKTEIDVIGLAVAPGFINMLSWADQSLIQDGRSMSDLKQGVTLEVFGEGWSPGPRKKRNSKDSTWETLGEYFNYLQKKGVSTNFTSFVGATTVRNYVLGNENRKPNAQEQSQMKSLVETAMKEGAMGIGSSLIYAPADYASTEELIELCKVASAYGGMYITHMRNESDHIFAALKETFRISQEAEIPTEIYHLKISNPWNWDKIDKVIYKIDSAQKSGLKITADMYTYNASGTSLTARLPTWVQEGGMNELCKRLKDTVVRKKVLRDLELGIPSRNSDPKDVMVLGFRKDSLNKLYRNKRLSEIARHHKKNANETMLDLITSDRSSIPCIFFLISEENVKRMLRLPYVSICSDAASIPAVKPFTDGGAHPRAYGSFARLLGKYVREQKLMTVEEAVRRLTSLPAQNLKIKKRGSLKVGNYADVVAFDPTQIADHATFENPHQYATGVHHVLVNGILVLKNGNHTGAMPGRCVRGPGYKK